MSVLWKIILQLSVFDVNWLQISILELEGKCSIILIHTLVTIIKGYLLEQVKEIGVKHVLQVQSFVIYFGSLR